ncbi:MAG: hypothetical protein K2Z81_25565, partial [Cyanobacteria bacterium]|nr:hypothetical protein [Cyanobacteriota bacterium]
ISVEYFQRGFFAVTIFHAVQYMALSWLLEDKTKNNDTATGRVLSSIPIKWHRFSFLVYWGIILALASAWVWLATETNIFWAQSSMILMMAVSAHHYAVDTRIWRKSAGH